MELTPARRPAYVVFDIETTGLDETQDQILEIGAIAVDEDLFVLSRAELRVALTNAGRARIEANPVVKKMHTDNGLLDDLKSLTAMWDEGDADAAFAGWLACLGYHPNKDDKDSYVQFAGNSIEFDRRFVAARMPLTAAMMSHRYLEISGMRRFLERPVCGALPVALKADLPHRALADAQLELQELRKIAEVTERAANVLASLKPALS